MTKLLSRKVVEKHYSACTDVVHHVHTACMSITEL
jgi:hypothetical protein